MSARARNWCFTLNNYTDEEVQLVMKEHTPRNYIVFGYETGENGTPHLQGYVMLKNPAKLDVMKKWIPRAHFEIARGKPQQNIDYCIKEVFNAEINGVEHVPFFEEGVRPKINDSSGAFAFFMDNNNDFRVCHDISLWFRDEKI